MFGWEFPPFSSGGLGTACLGLTRAMAKQDTQLIFVVPNAPDKLDVSYMKTLIASKYPGVKKVKIVEFDSILTPYMTSGEYDEALSKHLKNGNYGSDMYQEALRYVEHAKLIAEKEDFDVIHAHDWMTYKAGFAARKVSGKPLVCHIHATEFDRTAGSCNQMIYDIEREGMHGADAVIAVSNFTKEKVMKHYGVPSEKINVVHNGVEFTTKKYHKNISSLSDYYKIVLFLGRITIQKGPDWFLYAAKKVLEERKDVKFVFAGTGDMEKFVIEKAAELGISDHIIFTGFVPDCDLDKIYQLADIYVMPSISEPFGITPLEAMRNKTPVIISNQSGVSEVVQNAVKVDFWNVDIMAKSMVDLLSKKRAYNKIQKQGFNEAKKISWDKPAAQCIEVYNDVIRRQHG